MWNRRASVRQAEQIMCKRERMRGRVVIHLRLEPSDGGGCDKASLEGDTWWFSSKLEGAILCEVVRSCAID